MQSPQNMGSWDPKEGFAKWGRFHKKITLFVASSRTIRKKVPQLLLPSSTKTSTSTTSELSIALILFFSTPPNQTSSDSSSITSISTSTDLKITVTSSTTQTKLELGPAQLQLVFNLKTGEALMPHYFFPCNYSFTWKTIYIHLNTETANRKVEVLSGSSPLSIMWKLKINQYRLQLAITTRF